MIITIAIWKVILLPYPLLPLVTWRRDWNEYQGEDDLHSRILKISSWNKMFRNQSVQLDNEITPSFIPPSFPMFESKMDSKLITIYLVNWRIKAIGYGNKQTTNPRLWELRSPGIRQWIFHMLAVGEEASPQP